MITSHHTGHQIRMRFRLFFGGDENIDSFLVTNASTCSGKPWKYVSIGDYVITMIIGSYVQLQA